MTNPSLEQHRQSAFAADIAWYDAAIDQVRQEVAAYPAPLQPHIAASLEQLVPGEFSQVVVLLPWWLRDLLPVDDAICQQLAVAHFYGWWWYWVQDELVDDNLPAPMLLGAQLALLRMVDIYTELGLRTTACWPEFNATAVRSAVAYARELAGRCTSVTQLSVAHVAPLTLELVTERAAAFYFNALAQAQLAGFPPDHPRTQAIQTVLRCFTAMRQLCDDASDWLEDLAQGHVNPVAAQLVLELHALGRMEHLEELTLERLGGYQILAERFWERLERITLELAEEARAALAPFGASRIQTLVEHQLKRNNEFWTDARRYRAAIRSMFGIGTAPAAHAPAD